ncbi:MAG: creatininase family protein [Armatimonadetes bacterium]|nr:MAG: creatininase family protein [Armatimonadota bacterium]
MKLATSTWDEVEAFDREAVVVIPTGSLEQHGRHLPLFTDSLLVTAVAEAAEVALPGKILLTPTLWLGASGHHLAFPGSLSNSFEAYMGAIESVIASLSRHEFRKFYVLNGHGGNTDANSMILRKVKERSRNLTVGHSGYFAFIGEVAAQVLKGPLKEIRHSCEAEVSLMMHLHPGLVRSERIRDDGLSPTPPLKGVIHFFDEMTEQGSLGYATYAEPATGKALFEAAVAGVVQELHTLYEGYVLEGIEALTPKNG